MTTKVYWQVFRAGLNHITSHDILIEKISANTEFKLSPSIKELALSFRMDGHQSTFCQGYFCQVCLGPCLGKTNTSWFFVCSADIDEVFSCPNLMKCLRYLPSPACWPRGHHQAPLLPGPLLCLASLQMHSLPSHLHQRNVDPRSAVFVRLSIHKTSCHFHILLAHKQ